MLLSLVRVKFLLMAGDSRYERVLSPRMGVRAGKESCWEGSDRENARLRGISVIAITKGRRVPGQAHLFGDGRVAICVLRLSEAIRDLRWRCCTGRTGPGHPGGVSWDTWFSPGVRRVTPPSPSDGP